MGNFVCNKSSYLINSEFERRLKEACSSDLDYGYYYHVRASLSEKIMTSMTIQNKEKLVRIFKKIIKDPFGSSLIKFNTLLMLKDLLNVED